MSSVAWKINRLRLMGPAEVAWRVGQVLQRAGERAGLGLVQCPPPPSSPAAGWRLLHPDAARGGSAAVCAAADAVLAGRWAVFSQRDLALGFPPAWNRCPRTGVEAPLRHGTRVDYRNERTVGDIKYMWEPSRHAEVLTLALAYALGGDARHAEGARTLLLSWFDQCPYPLGVHWASSLELAIRLLNWAAAWELLDHPGSAAFAGPHGEALRRRWLDSVFQHAHFVEHHLSRHSSANNHLFGELMGLFVAALRWPCWPQSARWLELSRSRLECEAAAQTHEDGVNREQALWYHHEVADMMLLTALAARASGQPFSQAYMGRLEAMLVFLASLADSGGNWPMIGDSDDAVMVRFSHGPGSSVYRSLLASGAVLFGRAGFAQLAARFDGKNRWLFGAEGEAEFQRLLAQPADGAALPRAFPDGGYWVLGNRLGQTHELRLVADAGPLGYLSIAAHGHADALSFTLSFAGREMLIDPGTYAYHTQREWRDYFKGTSAHNTVRVDGLDQSVSGGNFMWLRHARASCERYEVNASGTHWVASHDGYRRLRDPVTHRRQIHVHAATDTVEVADTIESMRTHDVEVHWHFAEHCSVQVEGSQVVARNGPATLRMAVTGAPLRAELVIGQESPPLGWVSRRFDEKVPTACVRWVGRVGPGASWTTTLRLALDEQIPASREAPHTMEAS